jgi:hypothetical protein
MEALYTLVPSHLPPTPHSYLCDAIIFRHVEAGIRSRVHLIVTVLEAVVLTAVSAAVIVAVLAAVLIVSVSAAVLAASDPQCTHLHLQCPPRCLLGVLDNWSKRHNGATLHAQQGVVSDPVYTKQYWQQY